MPSPNEFLRAFLAGETFATLQQRFGIADPLELEQLFRAGITHWCPTHTHYDGRKTPTKDCLVCLKIYERHVKAKIDQLRKDRATRRKSR